MGRVSDAKLWMLLALHIWHGLIWHF